MYSDAPSLRAGGALPSFFPSASTAVTPSPSVGTKVIAALPGWGVIIAFIILLLCAICMTRWFFTCDHGQCRAMVDSQMSNRSAQTASSAEIQHMLRLFSQGSCWSLAFVGAAIATGLTVALLQLPCTVVICGIIFLCNFVVIYFLCALLFHHYIVPVSNMVYDFVAAHPYTPLDKLADIPPIQDPPLGQTSDSVPPLVQLGTTAGTA